MFGPVLRGTKCTLRPPRKDELSIYQRWFEDVDVLRFTPGIGPLSDAKEEEWFNRRFRDIWMGEVLRDDWERAQEPKR